MYVYIWEDALEYCRQGKCAYLNCRSIVARDHARRKIMLFFRVLFIIYFFSLNVRKFSNVFNAK